MTIVDLVRILRRNLALLLICGLLGAAAGAAYVLLKPVTYEASALGLVVAGDTASVGGTMSGDAVSKQRAGTYITLVNTQSVSSKVRTILKDEGMAGAETGSLSATVMGDTSFIKVTGTGRTAKNAQALANAGLAALTSEALRMETYAQTRGAQKSDEELSKMTSIHVLGYQSAGLPSADRGDNLVTYALLGLAAGLVVGAAIAVIRRQFDVKVRSQQDVETLTGHGVLSVVPDDKKIAQERKKGELVLGGVTGEAFRQLRTNLRFANVDNPPRSIVVTSSNPGDGKSTIASHLAALMAQSGEKVVLIDADMRRPVQHEVFGLDSGTGLSQVLAGDLPVEAAMVATKQRNLRLLTAGRVPPNPSELLGSQRMHDLITQLVADGYFVILDAPPLLAVTDAGVLGAYADGILLTVVVGRTHKEQVSLCCTRIEQVGATFLGSVLTRVPRKVMGDVLYGYGAGTYGYSSYYKSHYYTEQQSSGQQSAGQQTSASGSGVLPPPSARSVRRDRPSDPAPEPDDSHSAPVPRRLQR